MTALQPRIAHGGDHVQGVKLGIVLLPSSHPKILGDMANACTWRFPVRLRCVDNTTDSADDIYKAFVEHAQDLVADGCGAIATNYRFLSPYQTQFAAALGVPCVTSVLYQYSMIRAILPHCKTIAIMTADTDMFDNHILQSVGIPLNTPIVPVDTVADDIQKSVTAVVKTADDMCQNHTDIGAVLMESNAFSAYSHAVYHCTGLPVYDIYTLIDWFGSSLQPTNFGIPYTPGDCHAP